MDHNMVFSYGYCWWQNQWWYQNVPPLSAILMAMAGHRSNTDSIAQCGMSRTTWEATGCCHWAITCSISPQQPPGQQQTKWGQTNGPNLLAILMAAVVRRYNTACIAQWRRSRALAEVTERRHRASIAADRCNRSCMCRFFTSFFIVNSNKKVAGWH